MQNVRKKAGNFFTWAIVLLIAVAFTLSGVGGIFSSNKIGTAALINDKSVKWSEVDRELRNYLKQANVDVHSLSNGELMNMRKQIAIALAQRTALLQDASKKGIEVSDKQVLLKISKKDIFLEENKFSSDRYKQFLRNIDYTDKLFREEIKQDMILSQYRDSMSLSNFSSNENLDSVLKALTQTRDIGYSIFSVDDFIDESVEISEKEIIDHYNANKTSYIAPEQIKIEYITLSLNKLKKEVAFKKEDLKSYYEANKDKYIEHKKYKLSHLLINSEANEEKSFEKLESIKKNIENGEITFDDAVSRYSEDLTTNKNGGDLGWIENEGITKELFQAASELSVGNVSSPIKTMFGIHLIKVVEIKPEKQLSFDDVKNSIIDDYQYEIAEQRFSEKLEELSNLAFENPNNLNLVSKMLNLELHESEYFDKNGGADSITTNPEILKVAFSSESINSKQNSDTIRVNDGNYVVIRVVDKKPIYQKTVNEVESEIRNDLVFVNAKNKLEKIVNESLAKLKKGENPYDVTSKYDIPWKSKFNVSRDDNTLNAVMLQKVFTTTSPSNGTPLYSKVALPSGGYIIFSVNKVKDSELNLSQDKKQEVLNGILGNISTFEYSLYNRELIKNSKIEMFAS